MRSLLLAGLLALMASAAIAQDWGKLATVSSSMGVSGSRLCLGEASRGDIGCPAYAPSVTTAGDVSVTGNLSANKFIGDGSGLTGVVAAGADRITSGTTQLIVISNTGYISLTQAGTNTGWFDPTRGLVTIGVSSTGPISGTAGYFMGPSNPVLIYGNSGVANSYGGLGCDGSGNCYVQSTNANLYVGAVNSGKSTNIQSAGATRMTFLTNTGFAGVGTQTPAATLQVSGTFIVSNSAQNTTPSIYVSSGLGYVGIGTASPGATLQVGSVSGGNALVGIDNNFTFTSRFQSDERVGIANNASGWPISVGTGAGGIRLGVSGVFAYVLGTVSGNLVLGSNSKNVGVGTFTPNATLEVSGTVSATHFVGDGSGLTGITTTADRIVSGSVSAVAETTSGTVRVSGTLALVNTGNEVCDSRKWYSFRVNPSTGQMQMCRP
jgi:hypothetical protein